MVATFFLQRTTAFILFLIVPSLQISCFRKTKEKQYAKYDLNKRIVARLIWQLVIHSCIIFAYIISRWDGENNGFLAGVSLSPSLLARPSHFPCTQKPLFLPFQTPAMQTMIAGATIWTATWLYNIVLNSENLASWILDPRSSKLETRSSHLETRSSHLETWSVRARIEFRASSVNLLLNGTVVYQFILPMVLRRVHFACESSAKNCFAQNKMKKYN